MRRDYRVLIFGENSEHLHDFEVIFNFIGEPISTIKSQVWQNPSCRPEQLLCVIITNNFSEQATENLCKHIHQFAPHCSILLYGQSFLTTGLPENLRDQVMGVIEQPLNHDNLQDLIHRCQIAQEYNPEVDNEGIYRPIALFRSLSGTSKAIMYVREMIEKVAESGANVLILGESGTGKEVVARNIHYQSSRREKPFVPVNCGAIPPDLLESELFGHEKGAFTGAYSAREGRFALAEGGTLFLDEIGDMPLAMQVKLLRVLQERCYEKVGSNKSITTNVRVIAATHRNLEEEIAKGKFREDLYYRLNVFPIEMPALKDRIEDLPLLLSDLISRIEGTKRAGVHFLPRAVAALSRYPWSGNVRELANLVERMAILYPNGMIDIKDLPPKFLLTETPVKTQLRNEDPLAVLSEEEAVPLGAVPYLPPDGLDLKEHLIKTERRLIEKALEETGGVVAHAADFLKMRRTTLVEKMKKYGIERAQSHE